jgi:hypothetical protein
VPGKSNLYEGNYYVVPQFECSISDERITYFLKNSALFFFVALPSEMLALKAGDHFALPLGPEQTCAARNI